MSSVAAEIASAKGVGKLAAILHSPVLALTLAALFWSGNFVAGRALRGHIDPIALNFVRWLIALVLFAPFVWRDLWTHIAVVYREWRLILGLGATGIGAFHTVVYVALQTTSATNALLMLALAPIAILAGAVMIGIERPNRRLLASVFVSVAGAAVLITRGDFAAIHRTVFVIGDLWMLAGVAIWAAYSLLLRRRPADLPQNVVLAASIAAALVLLIPFLIISPATNVAGLASVPILAGIGYIAIFPSVLAFLFWSYGVSQLGPSRAGQFINLMPIFGAALAFTLLGETPVPSQIAGAALVLAAIVLVERRPKPR
jgi:drug/metabolite transporter (DMT)-like permease